MLASIPFFAMTGVWQFISHALARRILNAPALINAGIAALIFAVPMTYALLETSVAVKYAPIPAWLVTLALAAFSFGAAYLANWFSWALFGWKALLSGLVAAAVIYFGLELINPLALFW